MKQKNKCIIFGGGGFIGSHLVKKLIILNYPTTVISLGKAQNNNNLKDNLNKIEYLEGDIKDDKLLSKIITPDSYVFDLATSSVPSTSAVEALNEIQSHIRLIEICCKKKVKKIIFTSSGGGVYGNKKKMPISELNHLQPASPHAIGKSTIEYFLDYHCNQNKIPYVIYRISNPYGPGQTPKVGFGLIPTLFANVLSNTPPNLYDQGKAVRDFIYIDDLVDAITISFAKKNKYNVYNTGSGTGTKIIDIWSEIKKITSSNLEPNFLPKRAFDVKKSILDISRFSKEYKWKPKINLSNGLKSTWNWIKSK
ncbi:MAG: NAD-dependent epimerase/dehydratase family protein [Candidatus Shapirobacteria bacterium]|nr:NAD-dependent epimerase/dehydratase family protein [Candidatus Shapirobacteria bacterium]MDD4410516.1 NAD-dependent epimerase/dehydratase family protein [Candidatus Shapirobacteria bacterium]